MSAHSNVVGGSSAARFINCPGSRAIINSLPESVDLPSSYATEGSALHQVISEILINADRGPEDYLDTEIVVKDEGTVLITQELLTDCIVPSLAWFDDNIPETAQIFVEQRVAFPGIAGAFGTCDLIAHDKERNETWVNDWKYGAGVAVAASYPDPDDPDFEIVNMQLLFYTCAARNVMPELFPPDVKIHLSIVQPRSREGAPVSSVTIGHEDLDAFVIALQHAMTLSEQPNAPMKLGDHCRFAVCRTACKLHLAPLLDFNDLYPPGMQSALQLPEVLADILDLADRIEPVITEARRQAHEMLENGGSVPGYKLVPKRAQRKWAVEEPFVLKGLRTLKISKAAALTYSLKTPAQIEKLLKKGVVLPDTLVSKISSGTTLARSDDNRPDAETLGSAIAGLLTNQSTEDDFFN